MAKHHLQMRQWSFDSLAEFLPPPRFASFWERDLSNLQILQNKVKTTGALSWYFFAVLIISLLHVSLTAVFVRHSHFRLSTFTYPLFTNYAYRLHNYVQKFLPWDRRLEAGVLLTISSPQSLRGSLRLCSFFPSRLIGTSKLRWLDRIRIGQVDLTRCECVKYSGTPPYDHLVNTTTSLLRPLFFGPAKRPYIFL